MQKSQFAKKLTWRQLRARVCLVALSPALIFYPFQIYASENVSVTVEKRIKVPGLERASTVPVLTRLAWSEVTNQIVTAPFAAGQLYIINPDTEEVVEFDSELNDIADPNLVWSRKRPWLIASKGTQTQVLDTTRSPPAKPTLLHKIVNEAPRRLFAKGAPVVEVGGEEMVIRSGLADRKLDRDNPDIAAYSVATGERKFSWQFPSDGDRYSLNIFVPVAAALSSSLFAFEWVTHHDEKNWDAVMGSPTWDEFWVIPLQGQGKGCKLRPFPKHIPGSGYMTGPENPAVMVNGELFAFSTREPAGGVHVYRTSTCSLVRDLLIQPTPTELSFSQDGKWLLGTSPVDRGGADGHIRLWRTSDWALVFDGRMPAAYQAAFNKNADRFAVATTAGIYIYRINRH